MRVKDEAEGRQLLADYGRKLVETGLVQGTWGNISVRLDDNYMKLRNQKHLNFREREE